MSSYEHQHPAQILFASLKHLSSFLPPMALFALIRITEQGTRILFLFLLATLGLFVLLTLYNILGWRFFTYRYEAGYLHMRWGIFLKKERSIREERVQTINIRQGPLQRLFALVTLQVETAGGTEMSEVQLTAIPLPRAQDIKTALKSETEISSGTGEEGTEFRLSPGQLFLAGATSGNFFLLFSGLSLVFSQLIPIIPNSFWDLLFHTLTSTSLAAILLLILGLLFLSWLLSTLVFMVRNALFTIRRRDEELHISWGLITRKEVLLKLHRIQAIKITQGLLRQPFGFSTLTAEVAGGGTQNQNYKSVLAPLLREEQISWFLQHFLPEFHTALTPKPLPKRAHSRYLIRSTAPLVLIAIPLLFVPYGSLFLLLLPLALLYGHWRYKAGGLGLEGDQVVLRYRFLAQHQVLMPRSHIQSLQIQTNPLQRWKHLSSVRAHILSSPAATSFSLKDVDNGEVAKLWHWYSRS